MTEAERRLLEHHLPLLRYDSQSAYRALSAAAITDNAGNSLRRADGTRIATSPTLSLDLLSRYPGELEAEQGDVLDEAPDHLNAALRFQRHPGYANRVYGRVVHLEERTWLQYWRFYYYNPHNLLGFARHEGDWELVQVGLGPGGAPEVATFAHHSFGTALAWEEVERHPAPDGPRPVVYVAPFSNASYPTPGRFPYLGGIDHPRGDQSGVTPLLEPFDGWAIWPGRWGNSGGVLRGALGGRSPESPGRQPKWRDPERFHRRMAMPSPGRAVRFLLRAILEAGEIRPLSAPGIEASLEGDRAIVSYRLHGPPLLRPRHLYVTVHDAGAPEEVLARHPIPRASRSGVIVIDLPESPSGALVRVSAFDRRRRRSEVTEAAASRLTPPPRAAPGPS